MNSSDMLTLFVELGAPDAKNTLQGLMQKLETDSKVHELHLLQSTQQVQLYLLVITCSHEPAMTWPTGSNVWSFQTVARKP